MRPETSVPDHLRVSRHPERAAYDRAVVDAILDEALVCHVGVVRDGRPVVIPTTVARDGDVLYIHGSPLSGMVRSGRGGVEVCVTATLVDGLVLSRSAFGHSLNYRSVVVMGRAKEVVGEAKRDAMRVLVEHVLPGRWAEARQPTDRELAATAVLALALDQASAKVRSGPPLDGAADRALPVWAGVVPLSTMPGEPVPDAGLVDGLALPSSVVALRESHR